MTTLVDGWYWWRELGCDTWQCVQVQQGMFEAHRKTYGVATMRRSQWVGPIPQPPRDKFEDTPNEFGVSVDAYDHDRGILFMRRAS